MKILRSILLLLVSLALVGMFVGCDNAADSNNTVRGVMLTGMDAFGEEIAIGAAKEVTAVLSEEGLEATYEYDNGTVIITFAEPFPMTAEDIVEAEAMGGKIENGYLVMDGSELAGDI